MHKISIKKFKLFGFHGLYEVEKKNGQFFTLNIDYHLCDSSFNDNIYHTIDYSDIIAHVKNIFIIKRFNLLEKLSEHLANELVKKYKLKYVKVEILKSNKFIDENIENIKVEFEINNE